MGLRFTSLRDSLFDDHNQQFGDVEERLNTLETTFNNRLTAFGQILTGLNEQLTTYHNHLNEHRVTLNQQLTTYNNSHNDRYNAINQQLRPIGRDVTTLSGRLDRIEQQLAPIGDRFNTLDRDVERANGFLSPLNGRFKVLGETINRRFDSIGERLTAFDNHMDQRFAPLNQRLDVLQGQLASQDLNSVLNQQLTQQFNMLNQQHQAHHDATIAQIENIRAEVQAVYVVSVQANLNEWSVF
jgi:chromosome segregation ATPase